MLNTNIRGVSKKKTKIVNQLSFVGQPLWKMHKKITFYNYIFIEILDEDPCKEVRIVFFFKKSKMFVEIRNFTAEEISRMHKIVKLEMIHHSTDEYLAMPLLTTSTTSK